MFDIFSLRRQHEELLTLAEGFLKTAESENRELTLQEEKHIDLATAKAKDIERKITLYEKKSTIRARFPNGGVLMEKEGARRGVWPPNKVLTEEYQNGFFDYVSSRGERVSAALYEGSGPAGGYIVPVTVEGQVVPLAPTDMGLREIATVIPTVADMKIPRATTISTATAKAEGTGSGANLFTESDPVLDQFTLSAFMAGLTHTISWELAQDVPAFQAFAVGDMLLAQSLFEENYYVSGVKRSFPSTTFIIPDRCS